MAQIRQAPTTAINIICFVKFHFNSIWFLFGTTCTQSYKILPRRGIFLSGCWVQELIQHSTAHLFSSSIVHFRESQIHHLLLVLDTALLHKFLSDTYHFPSRNSITFCTPVLASPDKAQLLMQVNQYLLVMESIRLTLVKIRLRFSCCGLNAFLSFLLLNLCYLHKLLPF